MRRMLVPSPVSPGIMSESMPAEVILKSGSRTALKYLVQPILDSMDRAWREE